MNDSEMATKALEFALETYTDAEFMVLNVIGVPTWHMGSACGLALSSNPSEATHRSRTHRRNTRRLSVLRV